MNFELKGDYIELIKLLKVTGFAETGGMAKQMVEEGIVRCNGVVEERKRLKVRKGDSVEVDESKILVV